MVGAFVANESRRHAVLVEETLGFFFGHAGPPA